MQLQFSGKFSLQQKSFAAFGLSLFVFVLYMFILGVSPSDENSRLCGKKMQRKHFIIEKAKPGREGAARMQFKHRSTQAFKALMNFNVFIIFSVKPSILRS